MDDNSLQERQEDELKVIEAIYMQDVEDLRSADAWKVYRPPELRIKLKPQQSMSNADTVYAQVDMVVKCTQRYPLEIPEIRLENAKGLSNNQIAVLESDLKQKSEMLIGEVMLLELAQHIEQFLHDNNKPPAKSFYEEMMSNKEKEQQKLNEEQEKKLQLMKRKEEKERQLLVDEIQRRQEALKEETKKRKDETKQGYDAEFPSSESSTTSNDNPPMCSPIGTPGSPRRRTRISISPSPLIIRQNSDKQGDQKPRRQRRTSTPMQDPSNGVSENYCKTHTGGIISVVFNTKTERTIHRGACLGHGNGGSAVFAGIDTNTGELVAISEWVLKWRHIGRKKLLESIKSEDKEGSVYLKHVISIEQEILSLIKLHHKNLIHYLAIKYKHDAGKITVYILMEYSGGYSLETHLIKEQPVSLDLLKNYTEEILLALDYLHSKDVVHKNLRASSIFVDNSGKIRLSDYSIDKRMSDLYIMVENSHPVTDCQKSSARYGKKADIYQLGGVLLSLYQGMPVLEDSANIPSTIPEEFRDFLDKCLLKDERQRWPVHQLLEHTFIKTPLQAISHFVQPKNSKTKNKDNQLQQDNNSESNTDEEDQVDLFITAFEASGQSRLTSEFEILKSLGKGGFGDVIKVRNKLDRRLYAIKRIPLNPKSKAFNKKITREVKLLSRLNHENVVRYYNSWIETSEDPAHSDNSSSLTASTATTTKTSESEDDKAKRLGLKNSLDLSDDIEKFAPPPRQVDMSMDWSISIDMDGDQNNSDSDDDEDEDEADVFGTSFLRKADMSDDVVFVQSIEDIADYSNFAIDEKSKDVTGFQNDTKIEESVPRLQYLYIQMEYCERSTLRNCIDAGLYQDVDRVWRLFREIIEGLLHIHEQGMIHRDLKPVNIFLDSNDHVKIGDFGLATTNIVKPASISVLEASLFNTSAADTTSSLSGSVGEGHLTGQVGTALYVSPEMMTGEMRITYSQKVDIYSLGIIFFEMCYKPLSTGMERVQILGNLRQKDIKLPEDFDQVTMENQTHIIRWLLNHNPSLRPSSKDLLQSPHLPPPQMEEGELDEILRSAISDPQSKTYKHMVKTMLSQNINAADDLLYDSEFYKNPFEMRRILIHQLVTDTLIRIFHKHGAIKLTTPLLMPRCSQTDQSDHHIYFMDHFGRPVGLPFDLRVPFARFVARNNIAHLKRYCIGRVYRERVFRDRKVHGQHPRELTECAFDTVFTNHNSLIPDAELLVLIQDVIYEFPVLQQRNYYIRINHISILYAVLLHFNIPEEKHEEVLLTLASTKVDSHNRHLITKALSNFGLSEQTTASLTSLLEMEGPVSKIASYLRCITKTRGPAAAKAKQGLQEIDTILSHAEPMGLELPVIFTLGFIYNTKQYSGLIFQVMYDMKKKKRTLPDPLAAGGRYDGLIKKFYSPLLSSVSHTDVTHYAVGVSIAFEKIVLALAENKEYHPSSPYDILVCTIGHKSMFKEVISVLHDLWKAGLRADILLETLQSPEHIQEFCRKEGIMFMVIFKDNDTSGVKVKTIEKDRVTEKKVKLSELIDFLQQRLNTMKMEQTEVSQSQIGKSVSVIPTQPHYDTNQSASSNSSLMINFVFILLESSKLALNTKKKYESQIFGKVSSSLYWLPNKNLELIATDLNSQVLKIIVAYLELDGDESMFESSISIIVEKQQRHRKYLGKIIDHIHHLKFEKKCNVIALYGLKDNSVKLLT